MLNVCALRTLSQLKFVPRVFSSFFRSTAILKNEKTLETRLFSAQMIASLGRDVKPMASSPSPYLLKLVF